MLRVETYSDRVDVLTTVVPHGVLAVDLPDGKLDAVNGGENRPHDRTWRVRGRVGVPSACGSGWGEVRTSSYSSANPPDFLGLVAILHARRAPGAIVSAPPTTVPPAPLRRCRRRIRRLTPTPPLPGLRNARVTPVPHHYCPRLTKCQRMRRGRGRPRIATPTPMPVSTPRTKTRMRTWGQGRVSCTRHVVSTSLRILVFSDKGYHR